ncbi:hypothetical protein N431DRAFT_460768 [Stipitochalara longipes BDJ]|nr:hypothetical protein N431DRAFT_460768 [Stipitochalara longipes BDJ]
MPISIQDQNNIPETECLVQDAGLAKEGDILHRFKSNIQTANSKNVLLLRSAVAALLLGFIIGLIWHTSLLQTRSYITITTCGNTSAEAIAVGCEFDILSYSWMPPQCLDRDTAEEFEDWLISNDRYQGPWPFFTDETGKERVIDKETLSHRTNTLTWTTEEEHLGHFPFKNDVWFTDEPQNYAAVRTVEIHNPSRHNLAGGWPVPSPEFPLSEAFGVSAFHQLHCITSLKQEIDRLVTAFKKSSQGVSLSVEDLYDAGHTAHCMNFLIQVSARGDAFENTLAEIE